MQGKARCCEIKMDKNRLLNAFVMNVCALVQNFARYQRMK